MTDKNVFVLFWILKRVQDDEQNGGADGERKGYTVDRILF
jgi:hypothetical protein